MYIIERKFSIPTEIINIINLYICYLILIFKLKIINNYNKNYDLQSIVYYSMGNIKLSTY